MRREGKRVAILAFGTHADARARRRPSELDATVANMRFVKPLDAGAGAASLPRTHELLVTVEENVVAGGAGSAVAEALRRERGSTSPCCMLGLPDAFVEHGDTAQLLADCGLDAAGIAKAVRERLARAERRPGKAA